jgi:F-type H+-transporting ATPase subunit epsilon
VIAVSTFHLQVVTLDGLSFDGEAEKLVVRTTSGDVCILAHHINFVSPLGMGEAKVFVDGQIRRAACIGGLVSVCDGEVKLAPTTFEWAEDIDKARAERAEEAAESILANKSKLSDHEVAIAEAKLKRSLVRQGVARG